MTKEEFVEYVASFNPKYVTKQTAKDLINQAKYVNSKETHESETKESV